MKQFIIMMLCLAVASFEAKAQDSVRHTLCQSDTLYRYTCECGCHNHPANNYSGLNSLKARLANKKWDGHSERTSSIEVSFGGTLAKSDSTDVSAASTLDNNKQQQAGYDWESQDASISSELSCEYCARMEKGDVPIGAPLYLFFKIATTNLTDESQQINLNAIAELAKQWQLRIRVTGAADSDTGTQDGNMTLSQARADYVIGLLRSKGVPDIQISRVAEGGISKFTPVSANRHCKVELFKMKQ